MTAVEIEIVVWAVEIGWHCRNKVTPVLLAVSLTQLDARNLGDCIPLVCRFEGGGKKRVLRHGLRHVARVNARRAKEQELLNLVAPSGVNEVRFNDEIVIEKVSRVDVVGMNTADPRGGDHHDV